MASIGRCRLSDEDSNKVSTLSIVGTLHHEVTWPGIQWQPLACILFATCKALVAVMTTKRNKLSVAMTYRHSFRVYRSTQIPQIHLTKVGFYTFRASSKLNRDLRSTANSDAHPHYTIFIHHLMRSHNTPVMRLQACT